MPEKTLEDRVKELEKKMKQAEQYISSLHGDVRELQEKLRRK